MVWIDSTNIDANISFYAAVNIPGSVSALLLVTPHVQSVLIGFEKHNATNCNHFSCAQTTILAEIMASTNTHHINMDSS